MFTQIFTPYDYKLMYDSLPKQYTIFNFNLMPNLKITEQYKNANETMEQNVRINIKNHLHNMVNNHLHLRLQHEHILRLCN